MNDFESVHITRILLISEAGPLCLAVNTLLSDVIVATEYTWRKALSKGAFSVVLVDTKYCVDKAILNLILNSVKHSRLVNSNVPILHICAERCECGTHVAGHVTTPLHADTLYRGLMGTTAFLACSIVTPGMKVSSQKFSIIRTVSRQVFLEHDMSLQFEELVPDSPEAPPAVEVLAAQLVTAQCEIKKEIVEAEEELPSVTLAEPVAVAPNPNVCMFFYNDTDDLRSTHKPIHTTKERLRRTRIKNSVEALRKSVPGLQGRKRVDMATVLEECVHFISEVKEEFGFEKFRHRTPKCISKPVKKISKPELYEGVPPKLPIRRLSRPVLNQAHLIRKRLLNECMSNKNIREQFKFPNITLREAEEVPTVQLVQVKYEQDAPVQGPSDVLAGAPNTRANELMLNDQLLCNPLKEDEPFDPSLILNDHEEERSHFSNSSSLTNDFLSVISTRMDFLNSFTGDCDVFNTSAKLGD